MKTKQAFNLKDLLKDYYYVNPNINENNFPLPEKIETENWKIIRPGKSFNSEEALEMIKKEGCRPANIYELALFKRNHPEEFKPYEWMLAFGQIWQDSSGYRGVPYVSADSDDDFDFGLGYFGIDWYGGHVLLCFCDLKTSETKALKKSSDTLTLESRVFELEKQVERLVSWAKQIAPPEL